MKKLLGLLCCLTLLCCCAPALAQASEWEFDDVYYVLRGYQGAGGDVTVPERIGNGTVDIVDMGVFKGVPGLTSLTLPGSVLQLKSSVGAQNADLLSVSLPDSLMVIGSFCFVRCPRLEEITIPAAVRYIGENAFNSCESLKSITFEGVCPLLDGPCFLYAAEGAAVYAPDDQLDAYRAAFAAMGSDISVQPSGRKALTADTNGFIEDEFEFDAATGTITAYKGYATCLSIPQSIGGVPVRAIGPEAFRMHYYLALLTLPEGLETIGRAAFERCGTLLHVDFPSTLTTIEDRAFATGGYQGRTLALPAVRAIGSGSFESAGVGGSLRLQEGLESIGEGAFARCISLGELWLPESLKSIGPLAFSRNWNLTYVYMDGQTPPSVAGDSFIECGALADLDLNEHCTKEQMLAMQALLDAQGLHCRVWRNQNTLANVPDDGLHSYENGYLTGYTGSATHFRPYDSFDGVPTVGVGPGALKGNTTIEYFAVNRNDLVTTIGEEAFMGSAIRGIDLFDSVTAIGKNALKDCALLEELTIPASVTEIGEGAFSGLTGLQRLTVLCDASLLPEASFAGCPLLREAYIAKGSLPARLFEGSALEQLTLGEGVSAIGERALAATALRGLVIPAGAQVAPSALEGLPLDGIRLSADATDEQLASLSQTLGLPWYAPLLRVGEESAFKDMPYPASAESDFDFDPETGTITAYRGKDVNVVIPRSIGGVQVKGLGYNTFDSARDYTDTDVSSNQTDWLRLRSVVIPETVGELPDSLFSYCQQLETVVCYAPLESTGKSTFSVCRGLKNLIFVNGLRVIDNYALERAGALETLYTAGHLEVIGQSAFQQSVVTALRVDAKKVNNSAFFNCPALKELRFSARLEQLEPGAVIGCGQLSLICFEGADLSAIPQDGFVADCARTLTLRVPEGLSEEQEAQARRTLMWAAEMPALVLETAPCPPDAPELPNIDALLAGD